MGVRFSRTILSIAGAVLIAMTPLSANNPGAATMTDSASSSADRRVLDTVPRVGFYPDARTHGGKPWPEDFIFPSCMRAIMGCLGHPEYDYIHFMGVTGAAFFLNWKPGWHGDNKAIFYMVPFDEHMKLFQQAFDSTGYAMEAASLKGNDEISQRLHVEPPEARRRILASIDAGRPLLAHGVVGPPETSIIAGYDEGGEVLIGWSFFQYARFGGHAGLEFEENGMFRKRNWLPDTWDLLYPGERSDPVDPKTVGRRSLRWAVKVARTTETWWGRRNGLAAYDAWAEHLLRDADIRPDGAPPEGSGQRPFDVHDDAVSTVAEGRWYGAKYLARVAGEEPRMAAHLYEAAACYAREHDLMWEIWNCVGGNGRSPEKVERFADPAVRRKIVGFIHQARDLDEQAIGHIEAALEAVESSGE